MDLAQNRIFSYGFYREILDKYKPIIVDFKDAVIRDDFCIVRHDVEFSLRRTIPIASIDFEKKIYSSFLLQVRSSAYNLLSCDGSDVIAELLSLRRNLGLHAYVSHINEGDWDAVENEVRLQSEWLAQIVGRKIDRFSYHRPPKWILKRNDDRLFGMINMYGKSYFEISENPHEVKQIKYLADSRHRFGYGDPMNDFPLRKFQLLIHPDWWSDLGHASKENFLGLENEHMAAFQAHLAKETEHYSENFQINAIIT